MLLLLIGVPIYSFLKARCERLGLVPEPVDNVEDADIAASPAVIDLVDAQPVGG